MAQGIISQRRPEVHPLQRKDRKVPFVRSARVCRGTGGCIMTPQNTESQHDRPMTFEGFNVSVPAKYPFPWKYWWLGPAVRELTWLLDQNRIDDAAVYWVHEFDCRLTAAPFLHRIPE